MAKVTYQITISGIVQGVGFRPFIYRLAREFGVRGYVTNSPEGVIVIAQQHEDTINEFINAIHDQKPSISLIESLSCSLIDSEFFHEFSIRKSVTDGENQIYLSPDLSTCDACRQDVLDPENHRYHYPFTTCTYCGPRYSIIQGIPYDRPLTTMSKFPMCHECKSEYQNPEDRRYHSQPNACPECGPKLSLYNTKTDSIVETADPISTVVQLLKEGSIVAIKGLGGYQLACDATADDVVSRLRYSKARKSKPFAVMCRDIDEVRECCQLSAAEEELLLSPQNPIVLLSKKDDSGIVDSVAPDNPSLGVMLPYTPLHILLMEKVSTLVMTSANLSDIPIISDDNDAKERLSELADYLLMHDREIYNPIDDSVAKVINEKPQMIRRARGYVPGIHKVEGLNRTILAVGGELKNTFCINRGATVFIGPHIGDLKNAETYDHFVESINRYKDIFGVKPDLIAHDMHPDYMSTTYAKESRIEKVAVQHHHAHLVSAMSEYGLHGKAIGIALDGTGYGTDGAIWGCECGIVSESDFDRRSHLDYFALPGGDKSTSEVYRISVSLLSEIYDSEQIKQLDFIKDIEASKVDFILDMINKKLNCPQASSMGRLFDGVSALIGLGCYSFYEAGAAIKLEQLYDDSIEDSYAILFKEDQDLLLWDWRVMIKEIIDDLNSGIQAKVISSKFHNSVIKYITDVVTILHNQSGIKDVVLSGGVFFNSVISNKVNENLRTLGYNVFLQSKFSPGDGGIALGQLVVAGNLNPSERNKNMLL